MGWRNKKTRLTVFFLQQKGHAFWFMTLSNAMFKYFPLKKRCYPVASLGNRFLDLFCLGLNHMELFSAVLVTILEVLLLLPCHF